MKAAIKLAILFALSLAAGALSAQSLGYIPPPMAAYLTTDGINWNAWASAGGFGSLSFIPPAIGLYCQASAGAAWTPCVPGGGGGATLPFPGFVYATSASGGTVATAAQAATLIQGLTGCNTANYVFTPAGSDCVAGGGSGTVNSGTANFVAQYATTGTTVSAAPSIQDVAGTTTLQNATTTSNYTLNVGTTATGSAVQTFTFGTTTGTTATTFNIKSTSNASNYLVVGDQYTSNLLQVNFAGVYAEGLMHSDLGEIALSYATKTNCSSSASPAVCGSAAAGSFVIAAAATSVVVNTSAVTANSQIFVEADESLGTKLGVTCNTTGASALANGGVTARTAGTSFTYTTSGTIATNPACYSYHIVN